MKSFTGAVLAFVAGLLIGTAGSDDSLLEEARERESSAYDRGYAAATHAFKALAIQNGVARWDYDPNRGLPILFIWTPPGGEEVHHDLTPESFATTTRPDHATRHTP